MTISVMAAQRMPPARAAGGAVPQAAGGRGGAYEGGGGIGTAAGARSSSCRGSAGAEPDPCGLSIIPLPRRAPYAAEGISGKTLLALGRGWRQVLHDGQ